MNSKIIIMTVVMVLGLFTMAQAGTVEFTFEDINTGVPSPISTYMTSLYGSTVNVYDAQRGTSGWGSGNEFLWTGGVAGGDFEILFVDTPITKLWATSKGKVFDATLGADFTISAYNANYNSVGFPSSAALVYTRSWNSGEVPFFFDEVVFSQPVSLLVFSNSGIHDVGIDNLKVSNSCTVPEPVSLLLLGLGLLGLGAAGRKK